MKIPNYDLIDEGNGQHFHKLLPFMPSNTFRMLICGPSGCGKTNTLLYMLLNLLYFDKIYLYDKNLQQPKYRGLLDTLDPISHEVGYPVIEESNDEIVPLEELHSANQKKVIFDDFLCERNQKPLIKYFVGGRHKNCSVIYLSQSYYGTPKDIRLNCSHFCIFDSPSANETTRMCREVNVPKNIFLKATQDPYSFAYIDKVNKTIKKILINQFNNFIFFKNIMTSNKDCRDYKTILFVPSLPSDDESDYDYFPSEESSDEDE